MAASPHRDLVAVADVMTREVTTLRRNDRLSLADDVMKQKRIRHLPVLDEDGGLAGILSQRDLFHGALVRALGYGASQQERLLALLVVKEIMETEVVTTTPGTCSRTPPGRWWSARSDAFRS